MIEVVVYSKPGCHLCDVVKEQLARLCTSYPFDFRETNILEDPESFEKYKEEIPVVFINGKKAFKYRLDEKEFVRRLQKILDAEREITRGA
ncbi:MAG TPA: glutaredoxin family protein [Terriglobia bacterium]|nr:glutaredoxin family protein [Terriglobia bacterium]